MEKKNFKAQYILNGLIFAALFLISAVYIGRAIPWHSGFLHNFWGFLTFIGFMGIVIHTLWEVDVRTPDEYEELLNKRFLPFKFPGRVTAIIVTVIIAHQLILGGIVAKNIYNKNIAYTREYKKIEQQAKSLYDYTWKSFKQQFQLAGITEQGLKYFTTVAFSARTDGANLAWKWTQENTPLPYTQFVQLYANLSSFIDVQRAAMYGLETQKQTIAYSQNILLKTFPNNLYNNIILRLKPIEYSLSLSSDSTNHVFETGIENLQ